MALWRREMRSVQLSEWIGTFMTTVLSQEGRIWIGTCFLGGMSVPDIRSRRIPLIPAILTGLLGIIIQVVLRTTGKANLAGSPAEIVAGLLPGILVAVLAGCTNSAGAGDAVCLLALGLVEGSPAAAAFLGGILILAILGIILLLCKKADRKTKMPFIPFLLAAQILCCAGIR